jgi:hypothetical protein
MSLSLSSGGASPVPSAMLTLLTALTGTLHVWRRGRKPCAAAGGFRCPLSACGIAWHKPADSGEVGNASDLWDA